MLKILLLFSLTWLSGCGTVVKYLDATWTDDRTSSEKGNTLPPLEIPPELKQD
ncbi:MAG: hypothetical protein KAG43_04230 [Candidatus Marithrix sp.]|nr:hypothetical protein [Candidatus Marithrix sp.]